MSSAIKKPTGRELILSTLLLLNGETLGRWNISTTIRRMDLTTLAVEMDRQVSRMTGVSPVFNGLTPKDSASCIITRSPDLFEVLKAYKNNEDHIRLTELGRRNTRSQRREDNKRNKRAGSPLQDKAEKRKTIPESTLTQVSDAELTQSHPVRGGGDCLFASLAKIEGRGHAADIRRELAAAYKQMSDEAWVDLLDHELFNGTDRHRERWWQGWKASAFYGSRTNEALKVFRWRFLEGLEQMGNLWGDEKTVEFAATCYNCGIRVFTPGREEPVLQTTNYDSAPEVAALRILNFHYTPLSNKLSEFKVLSPVI